MNKIINVANTILGNEKAWALFEMHEQSPNNRGFHRFQIIQVVRDGKLAEWRKDMGLAKNFKGVKQLRIPALLEHTVDELMDMADYLRNETELDVMGFLELEKMKLA